MMLSNPCKIMITAGPTREALDPVRFISNHSSGKMGYALVQAAIAQGAEVILVTGPTALAPPQNAKTIQIESADEMLAAVLKNISDQDIFIGCAAVADYRPLDVAAQKIKKNEAELVLRLVKNPDIIERVAALPQKPFVVGFAAETENLLDNARHKLLRKKLDMIIANPVGYQQGFHVDESEAFLLDKNNTLKRFELQSKASLAQALISDIIKAWEAQQEF